MLSFFPRDVFDDILDLFESVSEGFLPTLTSTTALSYTNIEDICIARYCSCTDSHCGTMCDGDSRMVSDNYPWTTRRSLQQKINDKNN